MFTDIHDLGDILASLPVASKQELKNGSQFAEGELEDIVKRKRWEIKEAKRIAKKRKKLEKQRRKELRRLFSVFSHINVVITAV